MQLEALKNWAWSAAVIGALAGVSACGGSAAPINSAEQEPKNTDAEPEEEAEAVAVEAAAEEPESQESAPAIPVECAKAGAEICTPPAAFVKRLCSGTYLGVALSLFREGTPFTRGYLTRKTKAWNASGGASASDEFLAFDEEVLVLAERSGQGGGIQISGMGGYDALRWDGSCVTLATEELTTRKPPSAKYPPIQWRNLEPKMRDQLREDSQVNEAYQRRRKECQGASMGQVTKKCEQADADLSKAIVQFVKAGGDVGLPELLPE